MPLQRALSQYVPLYRRFARWERLNPHIAARRMSYASLGLNFYMAGWYYRWGKVYMQELAEIARGKEDVAQGKEKLARDKEEVRRNKEEVEKGKTELKNTVEGKTVGHIVWAVLEFERERAAAEANKKKWGWGNGWIWRS